MKKTYVVYMQNDGDFLDYFAVVEGFDIMSEIQGYYRAYIYTTKKAAVQCVEKNNQGIRMNRKIKAA